MKETKELDEQKLSKLKTETNELQLTVHQGQVGQITQPKLCVIEVLEGGKSGDEAVKHFKEIITNISQI